MKVLTAGSEIDAWCTKCKLDLGHRIVALIEGTPKRVVCLTCNSTHNYRAPKSAAAKTTKRVSVTKSSTSKAKREGATSKSAASHAEDWEKRFAGVAETALKRYSMELTFAEGDLIVHKKFGEGYVAQVDDDGKVQVMFRDQPRTLIHGRK